MVYKKWLINWLVPHSCIRNYRSSLSLDPINWDDWSHTMDHRPFFASPSGEKNKTDALRNALAVLKGAVTLSGPVAKR